MESRVIEEGVDEGVDEGEFNLVVENDGRAPVFALPSGWRSTEYTVGSLTVTVVAPVAGTDAQRRANGLPIVTFHDVALSASTCFASFFSYAHASGSCPEIYASAGHYHITAAGHAPDSPVLPASFAFQSLSEIGNDVTAVLDRFNLSRVVGFGVGAGASILLHTAMLRPAAVTGLILVSPLLYASSYAERALSKLDGLFVRGLGLGRRVKDRFLTRWLSQQTLDANHDLVAVLDDSMDRLNASNVVRLMEAEAWREDLTHHLKEIQAKVLLITGKESLIREHTANCFSMLDPSKTSWIDVQVGGALVHEEHPDQVARGISLFLQGFGVYIDGAQHDLSYGRTTQKA